MSLLERLTAPGPKRMLALDGGGILGALTLGFLERIEQFLREMSDASNRHELARIGEVAAAQHVCDDHFPDAFNLPR